MKKGISLVALIVTIIVLIIISSAVIINTMNSNVLDNAKNSVDEYNKKILIEHINISMQDEKTAKVIKGENENLSTAEIIDILKEYGEFNNSNLKLSTSSNTDIWLYDIVKIPLEEYVTIEYVNNTLSIGTELSKDLYSVEYTLDNGINWETYESENGVEISEENGIKVRLTKDEKVVSNIVTITEGYNNTPPVIVEEPTIEDNVLPEILVNVQEENDLFNISVELSDNINIDLTKSKYILSKSNASLGNDLTEYTDGTFLNETEDIGVKLFGEYYFHVIATDTAGNVATYVSELIDGDNLECVVLSNPTVYNYTGAEQSVVLSEGEYLFEAFGAQGGSPDNTGGKGSYTKGNIQLSEDEEIFIYVGAKANVFNGGGKINYTNSIWCGGVGGGATDFRLVGGEWNNISSLRSRIMVAAGGGGNSTFVNGSTAGFGGTLTGENGKPNSSCPGYNASGATQTAGGARHTSTSNVTTYGTAGAFGIGGSAGIYTDGHQGGGGGGGYYGGGGSAWHAGAGGGSCFISGYTGCNAVDENGVHTGSSSHYSGLMFTDSQMLGDFNLENGYAKITKYNGYYSYIYYKTCPNIIADIQNTNDIYTINMSLNSDVEIDLGKSKYVLSTDNTSLGTNLSNYSDAKFISNTQSIKVAVNGEYYLHVIATDINGNVSTYISEPIKGFNLNYFNAINSTIYNYTGTEQSAILSQGVYKFEAWGAKGGSPDDTGGKGAYTKGIINIEDEENIYVYVGGKANVFNGGGKLSSINSMYGGDAGGGATDFRLINGTWNNVNSLRSRIMVAAGGGGNSYFDSGSTAGVGGTLIGGNGIPHSSCAGYNGLGATQTAGGARHTSTSNVTTYGTAGTFGIGGSAGIYPEHQGAGGGGGYYGGGGSAWHAGAGGGSSFISGYAGCNAVNEDGIHTGSSVHYSNYIFNNSEMIAGVNEGNGYAKITKYNNGYKYIYNSAPIITVDIRSANSLYTVNINLIDNENIDLTKSKYVLSNSNLSLGTNLANYTDGTFINTTQELQIGVFGEYYLHIIATDNDGNVTTYVSEVLQGYDVNNGSIIAQTEYNCIDDVQSVLLTAGIYKFEAWGAQGGSYGKAGGKGGYTSGIINFSINTPIYIYVGRCGDGLTTKTFNGGGLPGGGYNARSGGGATDFRLIDGDWDNVESLRSRIMVAAGGGGSDYFEAGSNGGAGGGLIGIDGGYYAANSFPYTVSKGGTQTSGGIGGNGASAGGAGTFGVGGSSTNNHGGGGGGGYYGGGSGSYNHSVVGSGAGGSSFISGYIGCDAIDVSGIHTGGCIHYSGNVFIDSQMSGNSNIGDGLAKITQYSYGYMYVN